MESIAWNVGERKEKKKKKKGGGGGNRRKGELKQSGFSQKHEKESKNNK